MSLRALTRLQPSSNSLQIILKNTSFPENLLKADSIVRFRVEYYQDLPLLIFNFPEPRYDFLEWLSIREIVDWEWLAQKKICIRLMLADIVFTDQFTAREFLLEVSTSTTLKNKLLKQRDWSSETWAYLDAQIQMDYDRLLG
ncbi:hypothetical protein [Dyadobacter tibetensis]|uniref:hypothetical protein n=1 Tax=Dyadobacter tibetensis TaxID=1211851 RepID=UPI0004716CC8|nr:hypothetical protein [Dyadobacter tibetensis]